MKFTWNKTNGVTGAGGALLAGTATTVLLPTHLLWINLVTDCFPALAISIIPIVEIVKCFQRIATKNKG